MNKNGEKLLDFIRYCLEHPEERFWQALRNWSGYYFIFAWRPKTPIALHDDGGNSADGLEQLKVKGLEDTFYWE
jgi:hypothetical protein